MKNSHRQLVKVKFADPAEYDCRFSEDFAPVVTEAVGVLVDKKQCLKLAWLFDERGQCEAGLAIPRGCVLAIQKLSSSRRGRK